MSETVYYGSDNLVGIGNVGIGTVSPTAPLHVYSSVGLSTKVQCSTTTGSAGLILNGGTMTGTPNDFFIYQFGLAYPSGGEKPANWVVMRNDAGPITVQSVSGYNNYDGLTVSNIYNNIGIGVSNPLYALDVRQTLSTDSAPYIAQGYLASQASNLFSNATSFGSAGSSYSGIKIQSGDFGSKALILLAGGLYQTTNAIIQAKDVKSDRNYGLPLLINPDGGSVGIGLTNPSYRMDIYTSTATGTVYPTLRLQGNGGGGNQAVIDMSAYAGRTGGPSVRIAASDDGNFSANLVFSTALTGASGANTVTERMRITSSGLIGIGTVSPGVALEVTGNIRQSSLPVLFVYKTTNQTVGTGTASIVFAGTNTSSQWTIDAFFSLFTLNGPSGYYLINARLQTSSTGTYNYLGTSIRVNGVDRSTTYLNKSGSTSTYSSAQCQIVTYLNTNDYVEIVGVPSVSVTIDSSVASEARTALQAVYLSGQ